MGFVALEGAGNVRDLGGIAAGDGRTIAPGLIYRGGSLHALTADDVEVLFGGCGIRCVIDLRTGWEREAKPNVVPDGVQQFHIPFYDLEKVGIEYTRSAPGTRAVGRDIACDPDDYYRSLVNPRTVVQMRRALEVLFEHAVDRRAVYEHCSGGKDRAGILALLALEVLGASREAILEDYLLTNVQRDANLQGVFERFRRMCDSDEQAWEMTYAHRARPENLDAFYQAVDAAYGSMDAFVVAQLGFDEPRRQRLRDACCAGT